MIDLKGNPFFLTEEQCGWVDRTLRELTAEEKVGQLIHCVSADEDEETLL